MEIFDTYCWEEHKKVITHAQHGIPGIGNFSYWNLSRAWAPTPKHYHSDIIEIHCLIKGKRVCELGDKVYTVTGNEMFITFPYEEHSNSGYHLSPYSFYGFQVNLKDPEHLLGLNREYSRALFTILSSLPHRHLRFAPQDTLLLKQAFDNISDGNSEALYLGVQFLTCFLFKIPEFVPVNENQRKVFDPNIQRVLDYIEKNFREPQQLHDLAVLSGYSLSRFKIKFKEEVGITPANYITIQKLEYAKKMLIRTDYPISRIALDAGFSSSNYFTTVMQKLAYCTPSGYRELHRGKLHEEMKL